MPTPNTEPTFADLAASIIKAGNTIFDDPQYQARLDTIGAQLRDLYAAAGTEFTAEAAMGGLHAISWLFEMLGAISAENPALQAMGLVRSDPLLVQFYLVGYVYATRFLAGPDKDDLPPLITTEDLDG